MTITSPHHDLDISRRRLFVSSLAAGAIAAGLGPSVGVAEATPTSAAPGTRVVPPRTLTTPTTVSPQLQAQIGAPLAEGWNVVPSTSAGWRALAARSAAQVAPALPGIIAGFDLKVVPGRIAGVPVFRISPAEVAPRNHRRILLHLHGGGYVLYPGEAGAGEGMDMAGYGEYEVISVDYRMPPDHPFPAALQDALKVYRALLRHHHAKRIGVFGASAGGGLTLALMLRARAAGLPLPGAIAPGTPWVDLTGDGDSLKTNEYVDNVLVSNSGWIGAAAQLYAAGRSLRNPYISPIYADFRGLPPAILTSGTRDLLLSQTVRTHRKLRQAGGTASLQVFEGMSHAQFLQPFVPETEEAFGEISEFFDTHLHV